jgi:hypothetical protein
MKAQNRQNRQSRQNRQKTPYAANGALDNGLRANNQS